MNVDEEKNSIKSVQMMHFFISQYSLEDNNFSENAYLFIFDRMIFKELMLFILNSYIKSGIINWITYEMLNEFLHKLFFLTAAETMKSIELRISFKKGCNFLRDCSKILK